MRFYPANPALTPSQSALVGYGAATLHTQPVTAAVRAVRPVDWASVLSIHERAKQIAEAQGMTEFGFRRLLPKYAPDCYLPQAAGHNVWQWHDADPFIAVLVEGVAEKE